MFGNMFGRSNTSVVPQSTPPAQQQMQPKHDPTQINGNTTGDANNTNNADNNADPAKGKSQDSPLDTYAALFDTPKDDKGQPIAQPDDPLSTPVVSFDPAKLAEALKGKNLVGAIDPELMQKAMSGQDPQAFMQVLNQAATNSFQSSLAVSARLVEDAIKKHTANIEAALPDRIRNTQIRQGVAKNPTLSHPSVKPMVDALKMQIASRNPQLSPDQVQQYAENYWLEASKAIVGTDPATPQTGNSKTGNNQPDWNDLLLSS